MVRGWTTVPAVVGASVGVGVGVGVVDVLVVVCTAAAQTMVDWHVLATAGA